MLLFEQVEPKRLDQTNRRTCGTSKENAVKLSFEEHHCFQCPTLQIGKLQSCRAATASSLSGAIVLMSYPVSFILSDK